MNVEQELPRVQAFVDAYYAKLPSDYLRPDGTPLIEMAPVTINNGQLELAPRCSNETFATLAAFDFANELAHLLHNKTPALPILVSPRVVLPSRPLVAELADVAELQHPRAAAFIAWLRTQPKRAQPIAALQSVLPSAALDLRVVLQTFADYELPSLETVIFDDDIIESIASHSPHQRFLSLLRVKNKKKTKTLVASTKHGVVRACLLKGSFSAAEVAALNEDDQNFEYGSLSEALESALVWQSAVLPEAFNQLDAQLTAATSLAVQASTKTSRARQLRQAKLGMVRVLSPETHEETSANCRLVVNTELRPAELKARDGVVRFVADGQRERVTYEGRELELPSPVTYRTRAALSFDRTRLLVASHSRLREFDLAAGTSRLLMEGPWMEHVAVLADERVVFGTRAGSMTLDRSDPDTAALSSMRNMPPEQIKVPVGLSAGLGLCSTGDNTAPVRWIACTSVMGLYTVREGRILIVDNGYEGYATVFAVKQGELVPIFKMQELGKVIEAPDGRVLTANGREIIGLDKAWELAQPFLFHELNRYGVLERPKPPLAAITNGAVSLVLLPDAAKVRAPQLSPPGSVRVGQNDMLYYHFIADLSLLFRETPQGFRLSTLREREHVVEPPIEGRFVAVCAHDGVAYVATEHGVYSASGERVGESPPQPVALAVLGPKRFAILSRVDQERTRLHVGVRTYEVYGYDELFALGDRLVLSLRYAPAVGARTAFFRCDDEGNLSYLGDAGFRALACELRDGERLFEDESGNVYALRGEEAPRPVSFVTYAVYATTVGP